MSDSLQSLMYGMQFRRLLEKRYESVETRYGLYNIDILILLYLDRAGQFNTSKDIMKLNMFTKGHISQALSRLQKKGYIKIEQDSEDRRYAHNYLTEEASPIMEKVKKISREIRETIMEGVTEEERKNLTELAEKVMGNLERVL